MAFKEKYCTVGFYLDGKEGNLVKLHCELKESGAFGYGNRTCLVVTEESCLTDKLSERDRKHVYDTRYEIGIVSDFENWCLKFASVSYRTGGIEPWIIEE